MSADPLVARVGRTALIIGVVSAALAFVLAGPRVALGVLGGGVLIAVSAVTIGSGLGALLSPAGAAPGGRARHGKTLAKLAFRYALLGFLAYVMIARLRLHPIGLMVGATSIVAAVAIEAVRLQTKRS